MKKILFFAFAVAIAFSCGNKVSTEISNNTTFSSYISAYTSGVISKTSTISVKLTESIDQDKFDLNKEVEAAIFNFSPSIKGKTVWLDNRTLEFIPESNLKSNTEYIVNFNLGELKTVPKENKKFVFNFSTIRQDYTVYVNGLQTPDSDKRNRQILSGNIDFSDIIDTSLLSKAFHATQNGRELPVSFEEMSHNNHQFLIEGITRDKSDDSEVEITFKGSVIGMENDFENTISVLSMQSFKVTDAEVINSPEQYVKIHFSDPLKRSQNFNGMVKIEGSARLKYVISGQDLKVYSSRQVKGTKELTVFKGIKSSDNVLLKNQYNSELEFEAVKPNVRVVDEGVIIPSSGEKKFPFEAVNLKAVDVILTKVYENNLIQFFQRNTHKGNREMKRVGKKVISKRLNLQKTGAKLTKWNKFFVDLSDVITENDGAIYQISIKFRKEYANYSCEGEENKLTEIKAKSTEIEWSETDWGSGNNYYDDYYDDYYYDYDYSERDNPCHSMYYRNTGFTKNVILSDIGLLAKAGVDRVLHVFANDIQTTLPMAGIDLEIYNYQQQLIATVGTDGEGMASIQLDEKPFIIIASNGKQRGYLKLRDGESLSLSKFEVEGATVQKGVKGFIYGERGVWRPGDSLYLTFMIEDKEGILPENHPVEFTFFNPKNQMVSRKIRTESVNGIYDFRTVTQADAITGNYRAQVKVGNRKFTRYIKVETVKPNRLKINLSTEKEVISVTEKANLTINAKWLHGSPANKLKTKIDVSIDQTNTRFKGFSGYNFSNPTKRFRTSESTIFNGRLDSEGNKTIPLRINTQSSAPGMLNAHFTTKVFEEGGAFSINRKSIKYSPYKSYAGVKVPKGSMYAGTLETNKTHRVKIANVSENGKALDGDLKVKVYRIKWRYWWDRYDSDLSNYLSRSSTYSVVNKTVKTKKGKGHIDIKLKEWGRYLITVYDKKSGHSTGTVFFVDEPYWSRKNRTDNEFATMLAFSTDKEKYEVGEKVKFSFPSSANGSALISVESGSKIIQKEWIKTTDKETKGTFTVTEEMTPNVFVHITLLQPHENTLNDLPIRMYGIVPILVENKNTHLEPIISMPDVLRPETTATIKVKEKDGKRMSYTLAIVDEGLLDLTNFRTPNPWNKFYAREALGVKTWDLYDYVMNAFRIEQDKILAIGGGGEINADKKNAKANRFKPMVRFMGPFSLSNGTKSHQVKIPNYVGSVRVMVIAGEDLKYGNAEKTVPVRNPLMVLGTLPRVVGPMEEISLPINVFAMEKHVKDVKIKVSTNDYFVLDKSKESLHFDKTGDKIVNFKLKTANKLGIAKVTILATSGKETAKHEFEIDVRPANPKITDVTEAVIEAGDNWETDFAFKGIKGTNKVTMEVSAIPPMNLEKRLKYLIRYPHGCIEQTTSSVFPQLYLSKVMDLGNSRKMQIDRNIKAALIRLKQFQTNDGGFSYWPGGSTSSDWGTIYASHFVLEAEKKGYSLPHSMKKNLVKYMKNVARNWRSNSNGYYRYQSHELTQTYRLYVLALAKSAELGAMNRLKENKKLSLTAKWRLAGAYQLINQSKIAKKMIFGIPTNIEKYTELSYSYGSNTRDEAMILEILSLMGEKVKAASLAKSIAEKMSNGTWMSTQTTAYSLIAMSKFVSNTNTSKRMKFTYSFNGNKSKTATTDKPIFQDNFSKFGENGGKLSINNQGKGILFVRVLTEGIPVESNDLNSDNNLKMTVEYLDMSGKTINPANLKQGMDFKVKTVIYNPGVKGHLKEMALSQIFPSGWEIHNTRMDENVSSTNSSNSSFDFQDVRDDRVYTYFSLRKGKSKVFVIQLNATYDGKYYMPSILCEAMYDHSISSVKPGRWVEVVK